MKKDIEKLKSQKILVIGDIMLDEYHWCHVNRISPEAPVPICQVYKTTLSLGGAANVACNIQHLGSSVTLIGSIGKDSTADKLKSLLEKENISTNHLIETKEKPTILKSRIIAQKQHVVRLDREDTNELNLDTFQNLKESLHAHIKAHDILLLSDYKKGTLSNSLISYCIETAKTEGKKIIIDPKGNEYQKYKGATLLTPNFSEFKAVCKKLPQTEEEIDTEAKALISELNLDALLITRSEKGMSLITKNTKKDIPTKAKEVFDIVGAGDTVIATLSIAIAAGINLETACDIANHAAGIVVGKTGTATLSLEELKRDL